MRGSVKPGRVKGSWYLRVELPRTHKRNSKRESFYGTKPEAEKRLRDLIREVEAGHVDTSRTTIAELCGLWLKTKEHTVGIKTFARYESIVRLYLAPAFGARRAAELRPAQVQAALNNWRVVQRSDGEAGRLSPRSVKHILDALRSVYRWAVRMQMVPRNPLDAIPSPKVPRTEMHALDAAGVGRLLKAAQGTELETPIVLGIATGLRRGELLGLLWSDIDFDTGRLQVRRASLDYVDGTVITKQPKTPESARTTSLPAFAIQNLKRHKEAQRKLRDVLGLEAEVDGWVLTRNDAMPWRPISLSERFQKLVRREKLPHVRLHDLRHSFATLALSSGVDLKTVSTALGHSTISMTANTYVHATWGLQEEAASRIDSLLGGVVGEALAPSAADSVPQARHKGSGKMKKPRVYRISVVAPTGVEPVSQP